MEILILVGLVILNGVFAMSEIAIVTAKRSRLAAMAAKDRTGAQVALKLTEDPTQFLSTVQIGITSIGVMNGIFGQAILAHPFAIWLHNLGLPESTSSATATVLVVIVVTYISIVIGELVPKRIGQVRAEAIACIVATPMNWLARSTKPIVMLLTHSTRGLMRLLRLNQNHDQRVTEEDIQALLSEGSSSGVIEEGEHYIVKNVLRLDDRPITSVMVPRSDVVFLDASLPIAENYRRVMKSPHSAFPVCDPQMEHLVGVVNAKDLLAQAISGDAVDLPALAKPCSFVLDNLTALEVLDHFKISTTQMIFVIDEYGSVHGIVTAHDLLEVLTGEFTSKDADDAGIVRRDDGSLLIDGLLSILDLKDCLNIDRLPDEGQYQTLNGLIMKVTDRVPTTGEKIVVEGWQMEVVDMDGHRVDKVLVSKVVHPRDMDDDG